VVSFKQDYQILFGYKPQGDENIMVSKVKILIASIVLIFAMACVYEDAYNKGHDKGQFAGWNEGYDKGVSLGVPSEEWPEGNYIVWTTFNDSHLNNITGTRDGGWYHNYEYTIVIPIYDNGTKRMYPRLLKSYE